ncbi:MAG TPA: FAD-binding protein [Kineosporiaceae bacterium]
MDQATLMGEPSGDGGAPTARLLQRVAAVCPVTRAGGPGDALAGRTPAVRAAPADGTEVAAVLAATAPLGAAVGLRGGGTQVDLGAPPRALDLLLELRQQAGVLEYDPGDLVIRAKAGTSVDELRHVTVEHRQMLALDGPPTTLGGLVATGVSGPRRHRYGAVRDLLIGAAFVLADGTRAKAGGKVVKNVAGYDLCKLLTGSLGTLAVITEVTFRLHPLPAASTTVTVPLANRERVPVTLARLRGSRLEPVAVEVAADLHRGTAVLVLLFDGLPEIVQQQAREAATLLDGELSGPTLPSWWGRPPWADLAEPVLGLRVVCAPTAVGAALAALAAFAGSAGAHPAPPGSTAPRPSVAGAAPGEAGPVARGRAALGVLEAAIPCSDGVDSAALAGLRAALGALDGTAVVTHWLGRPGQADLDRWGPVRGVELMRAIKDCFDPDHRLAPGRFVGGI